jgi:hypothetical protein
MRASRLLAVPVLALTALACSSAHDPEPESSTRATQSAIINGQVDTTHEAVVALILQQGNEGGLCSGTIVKKDTTRHIGWVLTAAHCVDIPPTVVVQGSDIVADTSLHYQVIDYVADSRYVQESAGGSAGQPYDFAVVRIAGVDDSTPTYPYANASDGVSAGTPVTMVGYGRTTLNSTGPNDDNTQRHSVTQTVGQTSTTELRYNQASKGTCQGDSGGPDLVGSGSSLTVVGVHSFIEGDCNGYSDSGRVSGDLAFINGQMNAALPADSCDLCTAVSNSGTQECAKLTTACFADKDCKGYYDCAQACNGSASCQKTCLTKFPKAEGPLTAAAGCSCTRTCASLCSTSLACRGVPKCGYKFPAGDCTTCTESSCCQEALDCGADGTCYLCLKNGDASDPSCATNAARKKLANCVATNCDSQCAGSGIQDGADPPPDDGTSGTDGTTSSSSSGGDSKSSGGCSQSGTSSSSFGFAPIALALLAMTRRRRK